jgi:transcriptional regulator GlxA family with amidase domain
VLAADEVSALVRTVAEFHLTDRAMRAAQARIEARVAVGDADAGAVRAYLDAVRRYFAPYEREALDQLRHVDRALERLYQQQYNLAAERGVVAKRLDAVRGVLEAAAELGGG